MTYHQLKYLLWSVVVGVTLSLTSCMKWDYGDAVQYGKYVYCNCWSYQNRIIKIDTETDQVVDELKVGIQPTSLVMDKYNKMWTVTDGGYEGSPYGYEAPSLYRIDAETFTVEKQFKFKLGDWPSEVQLNGDRDKLYWINKAIWSMDVTASHVPVRPFLEYSGTIYYGLTVNPANGEVYIADAIDYQQQGMIYRYSPEGKLIDEFYVGIIPGAFCWKYKVKSSTGVVYRKYSEYADFSGWAAGFDSFSVSFNDLNRVKHHIEKQETVHQELSFEDEYDQLLEENGFNAYQDFMRASFSAYAAVNNHIKNKRK